MTPMILSLQKVDQAKRLVIARAAASEPDRSGEILDWETAKPEFIRWSDEMHAATGGLSKGNVRLQHDAKRVVGKLVEISFDDDAKAVDVVCKVVDDQAWRLCEEGCITGMSIGGSYSRKWKDEKTGLTKYTPKITEISLVDNPCIPSARIVELVKADGMSEQLALHGRARSFDDVIRDAVVEAMAAPPDFMQALAKAAGPDDFEGVLGKREAGTPLSDAELQQRRDAARARWEGARSWARDQVKEAADGLINGAMGIPGYFAGGIIASRIGRTKVGAAANAKAGELGAHIGRGVDVLYSRARRRPLRSPVGSLPVLAGYAVGSNAIPIAASIGGAVASGAALNRLLGRGREKVAKAVGPVDFEEVLSKSSKREYDGKYSSTRSDAVGAGLGVVGGAAAGHFAGRRFGGLRLAVAETKAADAVRAAAPALRGRAGRLASAVPRRLPLAAIGGAVAGGLAGFGAGRVAGNEMRNRRAKRHYNEKAAAGRMTQAEATDAYKLYRRSKGRGIGRQRSIEGVDKSAAPSASEEVLEKGSRFAGVRAGIKRMRGKWRSRGRGALIAGGIGAAGAAAYSAATGAVGAAAARPFTERRNANQR